MCRMMKVKYLGISSLVFADGEDAIVFDPCWSRPSLRQLITRRIGADPSLVEQVLQAAGIKQIEAILVSHTHYDHVLDAAYLAGRFGADVYGSESTLNLMRGAGLTEEKLHAFQADQTVKIGKFMLRVLPSVHSRPFFFNNDLGQTIDQPLKLPARAWQLKEGGSYDFLVVHEQKRYLIRPSFGYVPGELRNIKADCLFLGTTTLSREPASVQKKFFAETIERVEPKLVVPLHWDLFTKPLTARTSYLPFAEKSNRIVQNYCQKHRINWLQMPPLSEISLGN